MKSPHKQTDPSKAQAQHFLIHNLHSTYSIPASTQYQTADPSRENNGIDAQAPGAYLNHYWHQSHTRHLPHALRTHQCAAAEHLHGVVCPAWVVMRGMGVRVQHLCNLHIRQATGDRVDGDGRRSLQAGIRSLWLLGAYHVFLYEMGLWWPSLVASCIVILGGLLIEMSTIATFSLCVGYDGWRSRNSELVMHH
ncbi:hypothetical protein HYPSUDRAFT_71919 [Hypholoma sublateritium FD-334 SS-4]|uniref:Uncharacterized protein n=1 Tax=Hypholoma sublateritium (strain FD-334 SS-4) TaxID=945553 RepID=A0A0D2NFZ7_HYPSF|nr:hypothetical protein HYPSUDRAFT_71919 [Hypholoma sublateritium FD-334 SS-4]